ncbi:hypothetical protein REPUB_Repub11eG0047800 [Reevesia pubescens]
MASFKVLFCLSLHTLFLISSSGTRLFHPFSSVAEQALNKATRDKIEIIYRQFESKQLSAIGKLTLLAVEAKEQTKAIIESMQFRSSSKRALIEETKKAIKASIQRNGGNPFESKRLSPGGPDPQHH